MRHLLEIDDLTVEELHAVLVSHSLEESRSRYIWRAQCADRVEVALDLQSMSSEVPCVINLFISPTAGRTAAHGADQ